MCGVCLIRIEKQGPGAPLLSVLTTHDLTGRVVERWHLSEPSEVLPLVQAFLDEELDSGND